MEIHIKEIPHKDQRYDTIGDYWINSKGNLEFRVSKMSDSAMEMAVIIHELIEWFMVTRKGISIDDIDKFDREYEDSRSKKTKSPCGCRPTKDSEPGHDKHAPYRKEHAFAELIERQFIYGNGIDWDKYDDEVMSLDY